MREAEKIPGWIERGQREFMVRTKTKLVAYLEAHVPYSSQGSDHLRDHVEGKVLDERRILVGIFGSAYARALELGRYSRNENGRPLRWIGEDGRPVFRMWSRGPKTEFFRKALGGRGRIIRNEFELTMHDLERGSI